MVNGPCHHFNHGGLMQHADLQGVHANVFHHRLDLRFQKRGRHGVNALHAQGVLGRECGDGAHAVAAQCGKGFEVGLNAGTAPAVRASNGEHACVTVRIIHTRNYPRITQEIFS